MSCLTVPVRALWTSCCSLQFFTLGPPPSPMKCGTLQFRSAGLTERANRRTHSQGFISPKGSGLVDTPLTHAYKFQHGRIWRWRGGGAAAGVRGGAMGRWDGGLGQELETRIGFGKEVMQESGGGVQGRVVPWMKMRSVFGTCMVSGIRRREKVREWDRRSSRGEQGGGTLSDGSAGFCWGRWPSQRVGINGLKKRCGVRT